MKKLNIAIVAHVDSGKTTLCEALSYHSGLIDKMGRVDHATTLLDYDSIERKRKITITSKQLQLMYKDLQITLLDTPGHIDFSLEMERTLSVVDIAIVVINGVDSVQNHTKTIFKLLKHYNVLPILFFNKMDVSYNTKEQLMNEIEKTFNQTVITLSDLNNMMYEKIAMLDESLLDEYINEHTIHPNTLKNAFYKGIFIPAFFGSALKSDGIIPLFDGLYNLYREPIHSSAKMMTVYKITHDSNNQKLTHVLINQGVFKVKDRIEEDKINEIRIYSGHKYRCVDQVEKGDICVFVGLNQTYVGQVIDGEDHTTYLKSCMKYCVKVKSNHTIHDVYLIFKLLEQENPRLSIEYNQVNKLLYIQAMGEVHLEIIQTTVLERYGIEICFLPGEIIYLETIMDECIGYGHYEPLKHYAEIHIKLSPLPRGSGIQVINLASLQDCSLQYIKQVERYLLSDTIKGRCLNSSLTDVCFTILQAKSHEKHTHSGDFIEAVNRAVRYALIHSNTVILEPYIQGEISLTIDSLSFVIFELEKRSATYQFLHQDEKQVILYIEGPLKQMYDMEIILIQSNYNGINYTINNTDYRVSINQDEIKEQSSYHYLEDKNFIAHSIFCSKGAGYSVNYLEAKEFMHLNTVYEKTNKLESTFNDSYDLEEIFERTYGKVERNLFKKVEKHIDSNKTFTPLPQCVVIDGYNLLHEYYNKNELEYIDFDDARNTLIHLIADYQGYRNCLVLVVFDAYNVKGSRGNIEIHDKLHIIYTKEAQTADQYIELITKDLTTKYQVVVVTSDALQQMIILAKGATRQSSREFLVHYNALKKDTLSNYNNTISKHQKGPLHKIKKES